MPFKRLAASQQRDNARATRQRGAFRFFKNCALVATLPVEYHPQERGPG